MEKVFIKLLNEITDVAQRAISGEVEKQQSIVLFSATGDEDEEWTADIYSDIPDFPFYDRHGFVSYAAIKELHLCDHGVEVTGILKGDRYPEQATVMLNELDDYSSASLADYILSQMPGNPKSENINHSNHSI